MRCARLAWLTRSCALVIAACSGGDRTSAAEPAPYEDPSAADFAPGLDSDHDGLCDASELSLGTDRHRADSDGDGLADASELIAGTQPRDRLDPNPDRIAYLPAGGTLDFDIALVVESKSPALVGELHDRNALDVRNRRAGDFFVESRALSAEPSLNVRAIEPDQSRFVSVLAHTRLLFRMHFEAEEGAVEDCTPVLPFDVYATDDNGVAAASEHAVLIVTRKGADTAGPLPHCLPAACL